MTTYEEHSFLITNSSGAFTTQLPDESGKPQLILKYNSPLAKKHVAYFTLKQDLEFSRACIDAYFKLGSEESGLIMRQSLWSSATISYARCFNDSRKGRRTTLNIEDCLSNDDKIKYLAIHKEILDLRNNYFSHGGSSNHETYQFLLLLNNDLENKKVNGATVAIMRVNDKGREYMKMFMELINLILQYIEEKISKSYDKLYDEAKLVGREHFYNLLQSGIQEFDGTPL